VTAELSAKINAFLTNAHRYVSAANVGLRCCQL